MLKFRLARVRACLALTLATVLALFLSAAPARAHYENNPIPEVLGVKLSGDIRDYPGMVPVKNFTDESITYERAADEQVTFNGIPVFAIGYNTYENRMSRIHFSIRPEYLADLLDYLTRVYGKFKEYEGKDYRWYDYYFEIAVYHYKQKDEYVAAFEYLPIIDKRTSDNLNFHELEYSNVFLNTHISGYKFMVAYDVLRQEVKFVPGMMIYARFLDSEQFKWGVSNIAYITWSGIIYQINAYFDPKDYESILSKLREKYRAWDETAFSQVGNYCTWDLGEYQIILDLFGDNNAQGIILYRYWPLARQARRAQEEYRRFNSSFSDLDVETAEAP